MPASITLKPNVPLTLALLNPDGELDDRYETVHYQTSEGTLTLSYRAAAKLNILEVRAGEQFTITKHQREHGTEYSVTLAPATEKARAAEESSVIEQQLSKSIEIATRRPARKAPEIERRGTGTDGPAPLLNPKSPPPGATPYRDALKHINQTVVEVLNASGEQWSSEAKQDLVSTLFIQAAKSKQIAFDFTEERQA